MCPVKIKLIAQSKVELKWDDSSESYVSLEKLRKFCPCATCAAEREKQSSSFIPLLHSAQTRIKRINKIGNYAIGIIWEDGHNTGIYEFHFLKNISENCVA